MFCARLLTIDIHPQVANWFQTGKPPRLTGNSHPNVAPYDRYETQTLPIFLAALNNGQFRRLAAQFGRPDLAGGPPHMVNGKFAELTVT